MVEPSANGSDMNRVREAKHNEAEKYSSELDPSARRRSSVTSTAAERARRNLNAKLQNPLRDYSDSQLRAMGRDYALKHAIAEPEDVRAFELGAILGKQAEKYEKIRNEVSPEEMAVLEKEFSSRWSQPRLLYLVIILCSTCAAVQGMGILSNLSSESNRLTIGQTKPS